MPGEHARGMLRHALPDVMGTMIDLYEDDRRRLRVYISGDTLCVPQLQEIGRRFPDIDVALLHLGGTKLLGLVMVTMDGRQGADLAELLQPRLALPIHHDDYTVFTSPAADFLDEMAARDSSVAVRALGRGQTIPLVAASTS
jgi:L-ascorbate metabolism protein UlaG (beta-lactamase superfamily)